MSKHHRDPGRCFRRAMQLAGLAVTLGVILNCSQSPTTAECEAGVSETCTCAGGAAGTRVCRVNGFAACSCPLDASNTATDATDTPEPFDAGDDTGDVSVGVDAVEACVPMCSSRTCGDDGCGGTCGLCSAGYLCGTAGQCGPDPATRWVVEVVDATVSDRNPGGSAWDPFGGLPDPFVCVSIGTNRQCSVDREDTVAPEWNFIHPTAATAAMLRAGVRFEVIDKDPTSSDEVIGDVRAMATDADFTAPVWAVTVGRSRLRVRLTVAP